jgi:hypothetical protein
MLTPRNAMHEIHAWVLKIQNFIANRQATGRGNALDLHRQNEPIARIRY